MNQRENQELQVNQVCFDQGFGEQHKSEGIVGECGEQHKSEGIVGECFAPDDLPGMAHWV
jgi:hypothetical protein